VPRYSEPAKVAWSTARCVAVLAAVGFWLWLIWWSFGYELMRLWQILVAFVFGGTDW